MLGEDSMEGVCVNVGEEVDVGDRVIRAVGTGVGVNVPLPVRVSVPLTVPVGVKDGVRV